MLKPAYLLYAFILMTALCRASSVDEIRNLYHMDANQHMLLDANIKTKIEERPIHWGTPGFRESLTVRKDENGAYILQAEGTWLTPQKDPEGYRFIQLSETLVIQPLEATYKVISYERVDLTGNTRRVHAKKMAEFKKITVDNWTERSGRILGEALRLSLPTARVDCVIEIFGLLDQLGALEREHGPETELVRYYCLRLLGSKQLIESEKDIIQNYLNKVTQHEN